MARLGYRGRVCLSIYMDTRVDVRRVWVQKRNTKRNGSSGRDSSSQFQSQIEVVRRYGEED